MMQETEQAGSLYQLIKIQTNIAPDALAILAPGLEPLTYQGMFQHVHSTALQLSRMGISPGDRAALVLPNGPLMASAYLAISSVCTCAPLNPAYLKHEFAFYLQDLKVKTLFTSFPPDHPACMAASDLLIPVVQLEPHANLAGIFGFRHDLPVGNEVTEPNLASLSDTALVLHTSGTTSRPKIVPLTHRNIFYSVKNIIGTYQLTKSDRCLNMMPLFHIHGLMAAVASSLASGGSVICTSGFDPSIILDWMHELKPTWYTAVPSIHHALVEQAANHPERTKRFNLRFIRSCSASLPQQLAHQLASTFGVPVLEAYGMTEGTHQIASNPLPPLPVKPSSVGKATGTTQISILDDKGTRQKSNEIGEICIKGENVITAYENNPRANESNFFDGWLRTGDQGYLDDDGYLFIMGRIKELINRGGEKISPREIDDVLLQHPAVRQAVAFSIEHPSLGEDVVAAVVLKPNMTISMQELRHFTSTKLVEHKVPRLILFLSEIPKGATGKVQRVSLAKTLEHELAHARELERSFQTVPATPLEAALLPLWRAIFEQEAIGIHDDFLALGGDSLMAARLLLQVEHNFGVTLTLMDIFAAPTIESMAKLIQSLQDHNC